MNEIHIFGLKYDRPLQSPKAEIGSEIGHPKVLHTYWQRFLFEKIIYLNEGEEPDFFRVSYPNPIIESMPIDPISNGQ